MNARKLVTSRPTACSSNHLYFIVYELMYELVDLYFIFAMRSIHL